MFLTRGGQVSLNHSRHGLPERILYNQQYKLNHLTHITFFTLSVNFNLKCHANVINIKKILNWNMPFVSTSVTVGCTPEHSHSLVGCLKRAIDSSKQNQIKTSHLQTTKKKEKEKKAPPQSNVKRLSTWKQKLSKELQEVLTKFMKKKVNVFLILSSTCNNEEAWALRYATPGAGSILKAYNSLIISFNSHQILAAVCHRQAPLCQ